MQQQSDFGERLRTLRLAKGLSQVELAREVGRHQTSIGPYERNEYVPAPAVVRRMAQVLDTTPEFLLFGRDAGEPEIAFAGRLAAGGGFLGLEGAPARVRLKVDEVIAVQVFDDALVPLMMRGMVALVGEALADPATAIGRLVLAKLRDERSFVRVLAPHADRARFDLVAPAGGTMSGVDVEEIRPVVGVLSSGALADCPPSS